MAAVCGRSRPWLGAPLSLLGLAIASVFCLAQLGRLRLSFSGVWAIDDVSVLARLLIIVVAASAIVLSPDWFRSDRRHGEYYAMLLLSTLGAMVLAAAADLL